MESDVAWKSYLIFMIVLFIIWVWGCVRLFSNWEAFGDRRWGMMVAIVWLGPIGALWPICATPTPTPYVKYDTNIQYPVFV